MICNWSCHSAAVDLCNRSLTFSAAKNALSQPEIAMRESAIAISRGPVHIANEARRLEG